MNPDIKEIEDFKYEDIKIGNDIPDYTNNPIKH